MAATATARKAARTSTAPRRRAPTKRAAPRRRSQATPIPGRLVPIAVGRTAGAVGGLADSGVVLRLTRGRLWIGALAVLLVGIVGLNVMALSLNASSSKTAQQSDALKRHNSELRAQLARELSSEKVQRAAAQLGLIVPEPGTIRYLQPGDGDAAEAAKRLRSGELTFAELAPVVAPTEPVDVAPAATVTEDAPPADESASDAASAPPAEASAESPPSGGVGGVASP
jgi:hypothetical protein